MAIRSTMIANMTDFFTSPRINYSNLPEMSDSQGDQSDNLSEITCIMRTKVTRAAEGNREIRDIPQAEQTGRVGKSIPAMIRYHALLHRRDYIDDSDMDIARRVAIDSIPYTRGKIIIAIPPDDGADADTLSKMLNLSPSTLKWNVDELMALGVIKTESAMTGDCYRMTDSFREMWKMAFPQI
jgi:hypothetical protein